MLGAILTDPIIWTFTLAFVAVLIIARLYARLPVVSEYDTQRALSLSDVPLPPKDAEN